MPPLFCGRSTIHLFVQLVLNAVEGFKHFIPAVIKVVLGDVLGGQLFTQLRKILFELLDRSPKLTAKPTEHTADDRYGNVK